MMGTLACWHRYLVPCQLEPCRGHRTCRSTVLLTARPDFLRPGLGPMSRAGALPGRAHFCRSSVSQTSGVSARDVLSAIQHTDPRISLNPLESMGLLLHHPQFLEWIGAPKSARLLDKGSGAWMHSLFREQAIDAARQLHQDVCLMTSNLNVLEQYVL